jgi:hypothetical protein
LHFRKSIPLFAIWKNSFLHFQIIIFLKTQFLNDSLSVIWFQIALFAYETVILNAPCHQKLICTTLNQWWEKKLICNIRNTIISISNKINSIYLSDLKLVNLTVRMYMLVNINCPHPLSTYTDTDIKNHYMHIRMRKTILEYAYAVINCIRKPYIYI